MSTEARSLHRLNTVWIFATSFTYTQLMATKVTEKIG